MFSHDVLTSALCTTTQKYEKEIFLPWILLILVAGDAGDALISYQCTSSVFIPFIGLEKLTTPATIVAIPVTTLPNITRFLCLSDRALLPKSDVITCENIPIHTFILDTDQILWHLSSTGATTIVEQPEQHIQFPLLLKPPFNDEIVHHTYSSTY